MSCRLLTGYKRRSDRSVKIKNQTLVSKKNYGTLVFKMKPQTPVSKM